MATNEMYRQLLSQAVRKDGSGNQYGSALIGGSGGGALIGGYYPTPKKKKGYKNPNADPEKVAFARNVLQSQATKDKAKRAREVREHFINTQLQIAYAGRKKISYAERAMAIANAKIDLHTIKLNKQKNKREARSPAEKAEAKRKQQMYLMRAVSKAGFPPSAEGLKAYRKSKGYVKTPAQKALDKAVNSSPQVKAAKAAARSALGLSAARMGPGPASQALAAAMRAAETKQE